MQIFPRNVRRALTLCLFCPLLGGLTLPGRAQFPTSLGQTGAGLAVRHIPGSHFVVLQQEEAFGTVYEVVFMDSDGRKTPVLEMPAGTKTLSPITRAKIIAARMQMLSAKTKDWWQKLRVAVVDHQLVVLDSDSGKFIITADRASSRRSGMSEEQYASLLLKQIQTALSGKLR